MEHTWPARRAATTCRKIQSRPYINKSFQLHQKIERVIFFGMANMSILSWYLKRISDEPVQYTSGVGASKAFFGGGGLGKID